MTDKIIPIYTVQNADRAITSKDYTGPEFFRKLLVTSVFRTFQGEGRYAGYPAIFLRLAGCNYGAKSDQCRWCDTSFEFDKGRLMGFDEIVQEALALIDPERESAEALLGKYILVITGGEPTLQPSLIEFLDYVSHELRLADVMIETNGTQAHFFRDVMLMREGARPFICVSPKASYKAGRYAKPSEYVLYAADEMKFVLDADLNSPHHTVPDWAFEYHRKGGTVLVSPMAHYARPYTGEVSSIWTPGLIDWEKTSANYAYAAHYAAEHHLRISIQQHLILGVA